MLSLSADVILGARKPLNVDRSSRIEEFSGIIDTSLIPTPCCAMEDNPPESQIRTVMKNTISGFAFRSKPPCHLPVPDAG